MVAPEPARPAASTLRIGMLAYPKMTQLDFTGPYEVFCRLPHSTVHCLWKTVGPVETDRGLKLVADTALAACPPLDLVFVPGGPGQELLMADAEVLGFLRTQAAGARYVTSVCTGALVLGAAGLLQGRRATTHWAAHHLLPSFGAIPVQARVVVDGNLVTGGGVTAGIDFGLTLAAELFGTELAQQLQLQIEYDPHPPFTSGAPAHAPPAVLAAVQERLRPITNQREATAREYRTRTRTA